MAERPLRLLLVEDDRHLSALLMRCIGGWGYLVQLAETLCEAVRELSWPPDTILLDVHLPDGSGVKLAEQASLIHPAPQIVAMTGVASRMETYYLGCLGVRAVIEKPFTLCELKEALLLALRAPRDPVPLVRASVGHISLPELQRAIRRELLQEALARSAGNLSQAARLLGITRQAVQQLRRCL